MPGIPREPGGVHGHLGLLECPLQVSVEAARALRAPLRLVHDAGVEIHELGSDDGDLLREAVRRFRRVELDETESFLSDPATVALAMVRDREVVGWVWGNRQRHAAGYSQVQLYEIEVAPEHRGRGIGRALLTRFRDLAMSEGHRKMWLFTDEGNVPAKALYRSTGGSASPHEDVTFWWQLQADR